MSTDKHQKTNLLEGKHLTEKEARLENSDLTPFDIALENGMVKDYDEWMELVKPEKESVMMFKLTSFFSNLSDSIIFKLIVTGVLLLAVLYWDFSLSPTLKS